MFRSFDVIPWSVIILAVRCWRWRSGSPSVPYGRTLIAVGDNVVTARYAGVRVWWVKTSAFMISSLTATMAGVLLVGYAGVHPSVGARLRVHRDHRCRARRCRARRAWARMGRRRHGRCVRAGSPVHAAQLRRGSVDAARRDSGPVDHPRGRILGHNLPRAPQGALGLSFSRNGEGARTRPRVGSSCTTTNP
jgi:hypothetical protein